MKTSSASAIFIFGATALAAPAHYPYPSGSYPSGSSFPYKYTTQTGAAYPTGTAPCSTGGSGPYQYHSKGNPTYYYPNGGKYNSIAIYPTNGIYPSGYSSGTYPTGTANLQPLYPTTTPAPSSTQTESSKSTSTILPQTQIQYRKDTPRSNNPSPFGIVNRRSGKEDIYTAVEFSSLPRSELGKTCKLAFYLAPENSDVKFVGHPEHRSTFEVWRLASSVGGTSWADRPKRWSLVGKVSPKVGAAAELDFASHGRWTCAEGSQAFELVPVGPDAHVSWKVGGPDVSGLVLEVY